MFLIGRCNVLVQVLCELLSAVVMMVQVLIEFPCELVSAVLAGRWAAAASPVKPWMVGFRIRLVMAAAVTTIVSQHLLPVHLPLGLFGVL